MHGSSDFEIVELVDYLYSKRTVFVISCGLAIALTLIIGSLLPKRYTAKASILIEAPGNDPRAATALSPAYIESLKTWESFAASDSLFSQAASRFHLNVSKDAVLKVSRPVNSTVVEIRATLHDPRTAQALAQYIAEQAVELSRTIGAKSSDDLTGNLRAQLETAQERLTRAGQALQSFAASNPVEGPENELRSGFDFSLRLDRSLSGALTDLAELEARSVSPAESLQDRRAAAQARIRSIEAQQKDLAASLAKKGVELDLRMGRRSALEDEQRAARTGYEDLRTRLATAISSVPAQSPRLRVIDPGVAPGDASFPNLRLDVVAALLASLMGTLICLFVRFGYVRLERERSERLYSLR